MFCLRPLHPYAEAGAGIWVCKDAYAKISGREAQLEEDTYTHKCTKCCKGI